MKVKFLAKNKYIIDIPELQLQEEMLESINLVMGIPKDEIDSTVDPLQLGFLEIVVPDDLAAESKLFQNTTNVTVTVEDNLLNSFVDIRLNDNKPWLHIGEEYILNAWKTSGFPTQWDALKSNVI